MAFFEFLFQAIYPSVGAPDSVSYTAMSLEGAPFPGVFVIESSVFYAPYLSMASYSLSGSRTLAGDAGGPIISLTDDLYNLPPPP